MVAGLPIVPRMPIRKLGFRPCVRRAVCLPRTPCKLRDIVASRLILDWSPEQIDFRVAEETSIPPTRACACPTKRFTVACSFKPGEH